MSRRLLPRQRGVVALLAPAGASLDASAPPPLVLALYGGSLLLGICFALTSWLDGPTYQLTVWFDLDAEQSIPTWFASMEWFVAAALLGLVAARFGATQPRRALQFAALPLVFLAMSVDEIAGLHEWLGVQSDALLASGDRRQSLLSANGIWVLVIGVPLAAAIGLLLYTLREFFRTAPGAFYKIAVGLAITFLGALGFEMLLNFLPRHSPAETLSVLVEETLEMLGAATVVWGAYELAVSPSAAEVP